MLITDILFICAPWPNPWQGNNISIISAALLQSIPNGGWREGESTHFSGNSTVTFKIPNNVFFKGLRDTQQSHQQLSKKLLGSSQLLMADNLFL